MTTKNETTEKWLDRIAKLLKMRFSIFALSYSENGQRLNETMVWTPVSHREEQIQMITHPTSEAVKSLNH